MNIPAANVKKHWAIVATLLLMIVVLVTTLLVEAFSGDTALDDSQRPFQRSASLNS